MKTFGKLTSFFSFCVLYAIRDLISNRAEWNIYIEYIIKIRPKNSNKFIGVSFMRSRRPSRAGHLGYTVLEMQSLGQWAGPKDEPGGKGGGGQDLCSANQSKGQGRSN